MTELEAMKLNPNTTLESFEAAIRQDERQIISGELGFEMIRPNRDDITESINNKISNLKKDCFEMTLGLSIFASIASVGVALLCLNLQ